MSALLPCPWCQTTKLHLDCFGIKCGPGGDERPTDWRVMHDEGQEPKCEAWGPECDTREQAIAAWNRRAISPEEAKALHDFRVLFAEVKAKGYTAGAEAMREAAARAALYYPTLVDAGPHEAHGRDASAVGIAAAIRALPVPEEPK